MPLLSDKFIIVERNLYISSLIYPIIKTCLYEYKRDIYILNID
jgi:hypothetical protein